MTLLDFVHLSVVSTSYFVIAAVLWLHISRMGEDARELGLIAASWRGLSTQQVVDVGAFVALFFIPSCAMHRGLVALGAHTAAPWALYNLAFWSVASVTLLLVSYRRVRQIVRGVLERVARTDTAEEGLVQGLRRACMALHVPAAVYDLKERRYLYVNDPLVRLYNRSREALESRPYTDWAGPEAEEITSNRLAHNAGYDGDVVNVDVPGRGTVPFVFSMEADPGDHHVGLCVVYDGEVLRQNGDMKSLSQALHARADAILRS